MKNPGIVLCIIGTPVLELLNKFLANNQVIYYIIEGNNELINYFKKKGIKGNSVVIDDSENNGHKKTKLLAEAHKKGDYIFLYDSDFDYSNIKLPKKMSSDTYALLLNYPGDLVIPMECIFKGLIKWEYAGVIHEYLLKNTDKNNKGVNEVLDQYVLKIGPFPDHSEQLLKLISNTTDEYLKARYTYYYALNNSEKANEYYLKTIKLNGLPDEKYNACLNLGEYYLLNGNIDMGIKYLVRTLKYNPKRIEGALVLIMYYYSLGDISKAWEYYSNLKWNSEIEYSPFMRINDYKYSFPYIGIQLGIKMNNIPEAIKNYEILFKYSNFSTEPELLNGLLQIKKSIKSNEFFAKARKYFAKESKEILNSLKVELPNDNPGVSIVTITQLKRKDSINLLLESCVSKQKYSNIIEWIIVEGSKEYSDINSNRNNIELLIEKAKKLIKFPIKYIVPPFGTKLGQLRNIANRECKGDITVCMDDDDYYFPTRVSHAVESLLSSNCLIAGCTRKMMYDYSLKKMYKFGTAFGPNHSTNDSMAWKKEYLLTNSHDPEKEMAEEASFTQTFTQQMVQLNPIHVSISSSHSQNTFDKRVLCIQGSLGLHMNMADDGDSISTYVPEPHLTKFKELYTKPVQRTQYFISYYTGVTSIEWDPEDQSLGGSEQAVVNLATEWVKFGVPVAVYGLVPNKAYNGVHYYHSAMFPYESIHENLVVWRMAGLRGIGPFNVQCKNLILDLHDNYYPSYKELIDKYINIPTKYFFKSKYHLDCYSKILDTSKGVIIPNGIRCEPFKQDYLIKREPHRFCYCSSYDRGLLEILKFMWPKIVSTFPDAELHVYYGMSGIKDEDPIKKDLIHYLAQPGVTDHSRQNMDVIVKEKQRSTYHLYITDTIAEIDCISIRESLVAGCIPLISDFGVFAERIGVQFKMINGKIDYQRATMDLIKLMENPEMLDSLREQIKNPQMHLDWKNIAYQWLMQLKD